MSAVTFRILQYTPVYLQYHLIKHVATFAGLLASKNLICNLFQYKKGTLKTTGKMNYKIMVAKFSIHEFEPLAIDNGNPPVLCDNYIH